MGLKTGTRACQTTATGQTIVMIATFRIAHELAPLGGKAKSRTAMYRQLLLLMQGCRQPPQMRELADKVSHNLPTGPPREDRANQSARGHLRLLALLQDVQVLVLAKSALTPLHGTTMAATSFNLEPPK